MEAANIAQDGEPAFFFSWTQEMPSKTAAPTIEQIKEYVKLEEERKEHEQKARAIQKKTKALHDHFRSYLEGKKNHILKRDGYQLDLEEKAGRVDWKGAYIEVEGPLAAQELMAKAPKTVKVRVQKS